MCLSCGCGDEDNDHGNYDSFTVQKAYNAANAHGLDIEDVINNIENTFARLHPDFEDEDEDQENGEDDDDNDK